MEKGNNAINARQLCLTKTTAPEEIKNYFEKILELKQTGEEFPVNLDEVWPLVYGRKEEAVRALTSDFIQYVDYQALRRNAERGAASPIDYLLSVSCMEYFIARKVRPVFEVYRQVFHQTIGDMEGSKNPGRYDASRNILPGAHSPEARMIGGHSIWTILIAGVLFYRLKDIMNATDIYDDKRKETSKDWFRHYIYWINDRTGTVPHRYVKEPGVLFLISRTRAAKGNAGAQQFLASFTCQARENRLTAAMPEGIRQEEADGKTLLKKFMDIIISIQDHDTREFLYDLYKKLGG